MATHSSILAWEIPWTEDPGGLHSMESPRSRQDWTTNRSTTNTVDGILNNLMKEIKQWVRFFLLDESGSVQKKPMPSLRKETDDIDININAQHWFMAPGKVRLYLTQSCGAKTHPDSLELPPLSNTVYFHGACNTSLSFPYKCNI